MVSNCLKDLGGIDQLIAIGSRILLKPNLVVAKPNSSGATTNPLILDALIEQLMRTSPHEIIIGESSQIVDATLCSFNWELGGMPVRLNTILAGRNTLATDIVAASMLGYRGDEVAHLRLAAQAHLGPANIEKINIISSKK